MFPRIDEARFEVLKQQAVELFPFFKDTSESLFEAHKKDPQKNKRKKDKDTRSETETESDPKRLKRVESSGHRGSFYNKYKYWRAEFKSSGLWKPSNTVELYNDDSDSGEHTGNYLFYVVFSIKNEK